jgi:hypothetical protein
MGWVVLKFSSQWLRGECPHVSSNTIMALLNTRELYNLLKKFTIGDHLSPGSKYRHIKAHYNIHRLLNCCTKGSSLAEESAHMLPVTLFVFFGLHSQFCIKSINSGDDTSQGAGFSIFHMLSFYHFLFFSL